MAEMCVITALLNDLIQENPSASIALIGENWDKNQFNHIHQAEYFNLSEFLNLPFKQRYDVACVSLAHHREELNQAEKTQLLVRLRDLMSKKVVVYTHNDDIGLMRSLGFSQLIELSEGYVWQFNILNYKQTPDWLNARFWANPEQWDKFRW